MNASEFAKRRARIDHERRQSKGYAARAMAALEREARAVRVYARGKLVAWYLPNGQTVCKKRRYTQDIDAMLALTDLMHHSQCAKVPCRIYRCPHCLGWHLTSRPLAK